MARSQSGAAGPGRNGPEQLPAHARPWLRLWLAALAEAEIETGVAPTPEASLARAASPSGSTAVWARLAECHYQAQRLGQQQATLRVAHRTAARRLAASPQLLAAMPAPAQEAPDALALRRRWLARLLEAAADALLPEAPCGPVAVALLEASRQGYLHEAAWLAAWASRSGGDLTP